MSSHGFKLELVFLLPTPSTEPVKVAVDCDLDVVRRTANIVAALFEDLSEQKQKSTKLEIRLPLDGILTVMQEFPGAVAHFAGMVLRGFYAVGTFGNVHPMVRHSVATTAAILLVADFLDDVELKKQCVTSFMLFHGGVRAFMMATAIKTHYPHLDVCGEIRAHIEKRGHLREAAEYCSVPNPTIDRCPYMSSFRDRRADQPAELEVMYYMALAAFHHPSLEAKDQIILELRDYLKGKLPHRLPGRQTVAVIGSADAVIQEVEQTEVAWAIVDDDPEVVQIYRTTDGAIVFDEDSSSWIAGEVIRPRSMIGEWGVAVVFGGERGDPHPDIIFSTLPEESARIMVDFAWTEK